MKTEIQDTKLYKDFIKVLDIHDMRADDNPFVVACCKVAEEYASQMIEDQKQPEGGNGIIYTHKCLTCNSLYTRETGHKGYGDGLYCDVCGYYSIYPILLTK